VFSVRYGQTYRVEFSFKLISSHIKYLTSAFYLKTASSDNSQIRELGKYDPAADKHPSPLALIPMTRPKPYFGTVPPPLS
jgi:hypothetical protein